MCTISAVCGMNFEKVWTIITTSEHLSLNMYSKSDSWSSLNKWILEYTSALLIIGVLASLILEGKTSSGHCT